ncbi:RNA-binding S4 domain-containing protein [Gudongella oleilytica]|jgi:ribosome-associated protein|uniref:RNA-binding S4 domain-containing protein n=1 Tax=Gudongella oleilytica TaxID=1582259 RepID=UPI002A3675E3|nr:RNA-binding S4 domain-containing protein [Gudongella oleilytica]MDY0257973.1 RNA-binding S4 domain-containing protein [Gudongella oleilytica]HMM69181.1 RNA-binding S4 domain-containing protein [Gudongella oleilytica]
MEEIHITTDYIKLDQFLKLCGAAQTGGQAKEMIADGIVKVNDVVAYERGKKLRKNDRIVIADEYRFILI